MEHIWRGFNETFITEFPLCLEGPSGVFQGETPLHFAAACGHTEMVILLLETRLATEIRCCATWDPKQTSNKRRRSESLFFARFPCLFFSSCMKSCKYFWNQPLRLIQYSLWKGYMQGVCVLYPTILFESHFVPRVPISFRHQKCTKSRCFRRAGL